MNNLDPLAPRPVRESQSEMAEIVLPNDANPLGALLGVTSKRPPWASRLNSQFVTQAASDRGWFFVG